MKSQSLPMYAIALIVIGLVVLAVFLLYSFGIFGQSKGLFGKWFSWGQQNSKSASDIASGLSG